jgi:hypothetical protein
VGISWSRSKYGTDHLGGEAVFLGMAAWLGSSGSSLSAGPGSGLVNECEPLYFMVVLLWRSKFGCGQGMRVPARRKAAARLLPPTNRPPKKETAILALPLPRTGRAQSGCYLASTMDCSAGLSAEHYMSKSVLEALGDIVAVDGAPWLAPGEQKEIGVNSLTGSSWLIATYSMAKRPVYESGQSTTSMCRLGFAAC